MIALGKDSSDPETIEEEPLSSDITPQGRFLEESAEQELEEQAEEELGIEQRILGLMIIFVSAWTFAVNSIFNRKLKAVNFAVVMVYHALLGGILSILYIGVESFIAGKFRIYTSRQYLILAATALMDAIACFSMTIAYQKDSSGFISLLGYSTIVYAFLADIFVIPQTIYPLEYAGTIIILVVTVTIATIKLI